MVLEQVGKPLELRELPVPQPAANEVLVAIEACGVCRTDLHIVDGDLAPPDEPRIPGHQVVGVVQQIGESVEGISPNDRVGIPWLGRTCGVCQYCRAGRENLCNSAEFTGYTRDGGFAEYVTADSQFCFKLPNKYAVTELAPLLCAGLIGYRSYRFAGSAQRLGLYGFGSAAHILAQVAISQGRDVYAFTRPGDTQGQEFAMSVGATWAGGSDAEPPERLDAAIIFAPVGPLVVEALRYLKKGSPVICAGIHMSDIPKFPYSLLWEERRIQSVANLTRRDGEEFFDAIRDIDVSPRITTYPLAEANTALEALREGSVDGSIVLEVSK